MSSTNGVTATVDDGDNSVTGTYEKETYAMPGEFAVGYNSRVVSADDFAYTIEGLTPGKTYYASVSAITSMGIGAPVLPSSASVTLPKQTPEVPQNVAVSVHSGSSTTLDVSYDAPVSDGGSDITSYRIELDTSVAFSNPIYSIVAFAGGSRGGAGGGAGMGGRGKKPKPVGVVGCCSRRGGGSGSGGLFSSVRVGVGIGCTGGVGGVGGNGRGRGGRCSPRLVRWRCLLLGRTESGTENGNRDTLAGAVDHIDLFNGDQQTARAPPHASFGGVRRRRLARRLGGVAVHFVRPAVQPRI